MLDRPMAFVYGATVSGFSIIVFKSFLAFKGYAPEPTYKDLQILLLLCLVGVATRILEIKIEEEFEKNKELLLELLEPLPRWEPYADTTIGNAINEIKNETPHGRKLVNRYMKNTKRREASRV